MAAIKIDSGEIEATDSLDYVPREKWHDLMLKRATYLGIRLPHDCRCLVQFVADAEIMQQAGVGNFATTDDMIRDGLHLDPDEIRLAVDWLKITDPKHDVPLDVAVRLGKHGVNQHTPRLGDSNTISSIGRGRAYILARLERDGLDGLAARVRAGSLSANQAAIEAGFRKKPVRRCPNCGHEW